MNMKKQGSGIVSDALGTVAKGAHYLASNYLIPKGEKLSFGEMHIPQLQWNLHSGLSLARGSYIGPGTQIIDRLKKGVKPVSTADEISKRHDIAYALAQGDSKKVRAADQKMVGDAMKSLSIFSPIESLNSLIAAAGIKAKMIGEDIGLVNQYGAEVDKKKLSQEDKNLLQSSLNELDKKYGSGHQYHKHHKHMKKTLHRKYLK